MDWHLLVGVAAWYGEYTICNKYRTFTPTLPAATRRYPASRKPVRAGVIILLFGGKSNSAYLE
jgi:hypothetical protein